MLSPRFLTPGLVLATALLAAVLGRASLHAADGDLAVQIWSIEQGLPNSTVTALAQTRDGYLWVGTFNGLARFDGVRFVTFNPANTPAMKHARVQRLHVDANDTLWINTYDGALISLRDGVFAEEWKSSTSLPSAKIFPVPTRGREILFAAESGELIRRPLGAQKPGRWKVLKPPIERRENAIYCEDDAGVLWCLTRDGRIWQVVGDTFVPIASEETLGSPPRRLITDQAGKLWVCTNRDILRWNGTRFESMAPTEAKGPLEVRFLYFPREGGYWTIADGRFRKVVDRQWTQEVAEWRSPLNLDFPIYQQMYQDRQGGLWFAPPHRGVFYLSPEGQPRQLRTQEGLPTDFITTCFEDREGNIWLGAEHGGLIRLRQTRFQTLHLGGDMPAAPAISVCEDRDSAIWVSTFGNGLVRAKQGRTERFYASIEPQGRYAFSAFPDASGQIWVSAGGEDLYLVADGALKPAPWRVHGIKAIFVDHSDRVWIGAKDQLFCLAKGKLQAIEPFTAGNRHEVRAITEDGLGNIWVGLGSGELYRYDNSKFVVFQPDDLAESYPIWSLCADKDGTLWVGTFGGGLLRFKDNRFFRYTKKAGLPDDVISQILDDGAGQLWIGSYQGVFRIAKAALRAFANGEIATVPSLVFGRHDGLPSLECTGGYQPAAWRSHDGTLWFATVGGVAYLSPARLAANSSPTSVIVENVIVDGESQPVPASAHEGRLADRAKPGALEIPAGGKHLEFQYTGLCFASPDQVRFRYKLEGLEKAWNEVGPRRFAQYSFLHPGSYRFLVSACNSDGVWNEAAAGLAIKVLPYFWETWWFIGLFGLTSLGVIAAAVHRLSTRGLRRKLQGLERQRAIQEDRARIARDIHDDLGAGLTQITLFSELLRRAPPDRVGEHVQQISETAHALTRAMDETVWALNPKNDTLESLISYICSFAQEYLRSANVKCRLELPAQLPAAPVSSEIRHNLFVSAKEALNNILKHADADEVWLRLGLTRDTFSLTIEDDGRGMGAGPPSGANGSRLSGGNGLGNLNTRMASVGGTCSCSAGTGGRGIRIVLEVPFGDGSTSGH